MKNWSEVERDSLKDDFRVNTLSFLVSLLSLLCLCVSLYDEEGEKKTFGR